jgi:plastocyanin
MSENHPVGPVVHLIPVTFDPATASVTLEYEKTALKPGDRVVWEFFGLPTGWSPWIEFRSEVTSGCFLGPFDGLTQTSASLWGTCREDPALKGKRFFYRISVQKGVGVGWESGMTVVNSSAGTLEIRSDDAGTPHQFTVTRGEEHTLTITPNAVTLCLGDTVEWIFEDIEEDENAWRPVVNFTHSENVTDEVPNDYLGPFTALETEVARVRGMGNTRVDGFYHFQVSVVKVSTGQILWMSSGDPVIDNRGGGGGVVDPPPDGGGR